MRKDVLKILGLDAEPIKPVYGPNDSTSPNYTTPFKPDIDDLTKLYEFALQRKATTILEFGSGYSTLILAAAMQKNKARFEADEKILELRRNNPFEIHSIECSEYWLSNTQKIIPGWCRERSHLHYSSCSIGTFNGKMVHYYDKLPNIM